MREDTLHHLPGKAVNHTKAKLRIIPAVVIFTCALAWGCSSAPKPVAETILPAPSVQPEQPQEAAKLAPPQPNEVQEAVKRVFKGSALIDSSVNPAFVTGDFNGDLSQDLAVVLKPDSARVAELNEELPSWILRDLSGAKDSQGARLLVGADEKLLAVIHGYGANGWRDPQATQTFLLKNAAGVSMEAQTKKKLLAANQGRKVPSLRGDVVAEVLSGKSGYLYFANSTYAWYDPKTFTGEPLPVRGHGAGPKKMNH
ncbi:MAG TPA: hypothetical protein VGN90_09490 [Pyrinomonadaceae bacterium]|nr:hypothetical protein [Pyrinomonadaceae bacterium]